MTLSLGMGLGNGSIVSMGLGGRCKAPPAPLVSVEKTTIGTYKGRPVLKTEVMDYFRATDTWTRLKTPPASSPDWLLVNKSRTSTIDVSFEDLPDPVSPSYLTLAQNPTENNFIRPKRWRPQAINIRGTINQPYYFSYIVYDDIEVRPPRKKKRTVLAKKRGQPRGKSKAGRPKKPKAGARRSRIMV